MPCEAVRRLAHRSALAILVAIGIAVVTTPVAEGASGLCGAKAGSPSGDYRHVVVIMDENKSFSDIVGPRGSAARRHAPFLNHLARVCGLAANYRGITHPSHPNYMAITGGIPAMGSSEGPNIFRQVRRSGETWRVYNPSMPHPCQRTAAYPYKPGHNPGIAWLRIAEDCRRWDVSGRALARDIAHHSLPAYAFITPDQCHNMHASCNPRKGAVRAGDDWLRNGSDDSPSSPATPPDAPPSSSPGTKDHTAKAQTNTAKTASHPTTATTKPATSPPSSSPPTSAPAPEATNPSATTRSSTPLNDSSDTTATSATPTTHSPAAWAMPSDYDPRARTISRVRFRSHRYLKVVTVRRRVAR